MITLFHSSKNKARSHIGELYADIVLEEVHDSTVEITDHPVESGADISDHARIMPKMVTLRGGVSDSPPSALGMGFVNWASSLLGGGVQSSRSQEFFEKLLQLQENLEPFDIMTRRRLYQNMLITSLTIPDEPNTANALLFTAECKEIIIVNTEVTSVPPRASQQNPNRTGGVANTGNKQAGSTTTSKRVSIMASGAGGGQRYNRNVST